MRFVSDNAATVDPAVLDAMAAANKVDDGYDTDALSRSLNGAFSDLFGTEVTALWITTGTAANAVALSTMVPPHAGVFCHAEAHVNTDECGAPEFFTHGAKLMPVQGIGAKLDPASIIAVHRADRTDVHRVQPRALTITNATEYGLVYTPDEVGALGRVARELGLGFHMDGARFANAVATLGCHPSEVTWRAGIEALSFGFVKNGGLSAEALVYFRKDFADVARIRIKRSGHLLSKGRYLAAQLLAMIEDDRWLANARSANAAASRIAVAAYGRLSVPVQANEVFMQMSAEAAASLRSQGFAFYDWGRGEARFVTSWDQSVQDVDALTTAIRGLRQPAAPDKIHPAPATSPD